MKNESAVCVSIIKTIVTAIVPVLTSVLILLIPGCSCAQEKFVLEAVPVNFVAKNAGLKVNGTISGLRGYLLIDSTDSRPLKIEGSVDASTIETGIGLRDSHLKKEEYLHTEKFHTITITSTSIDQKTNDQYVGHFDLTIKNTKKSIVIPFQLSRTGQIYLLKAVFTIDRQDFQVGGNSFLLSDDVTVQIDFKTTPSSDR